MRKEAILNCRVHRETSTLLSMLGARGLRAFLLLLGGLSAFAAVAAVGQRTAVAPAPQKIRNLERPMFFERSSATDQELGQEFLAHGKGHRLALTKNEVMLSPD